MASQDAVTAEATDSIGSIIIPGVDEKEKEAEKETTQKGKKDVVFPIDPSMFNPLGLKRVDRDGTKNGKIINWMDPISNTEVFRWDENLNYPNGSHYHISGLEDHFYPGDAVPEPYASLYFPF